MSHDITHFLFCFWQMKYNLSPCPRNKETAKLFWHASNDRFMTVQLSKKILEYFPKICHFYFVLSFNLIENSNRYLIFTASLMGLWGVLAKIIYFYSCVSDEKENHTDTCTHTCKTRDSMLFSPGAGYRASHVCNSLYMRPGLSPSCLYGNLLCVYA